MGKKERFLIVSTPSGTTTLPTPAVAGEHLCQLKHLSSEE